MTRSPDIDFHIILKPLLLPSGKKLHTMGRDNMADNKDLTQRLKMKSIARLLLWVFPFFGIIYILGWRKLLERNGVFVGTEL